MIDSAAERDPLEIEVPSLVQLFLAFAGISAIGFGGVLPWARRMLVEQRRWMTPDEFNEVLSLSQFLPGGNIINMAVVVGQRYRGAPGSIVAVCGLLAAPTVIVIVLASLYGRYGQFEAVHSGLDGVTAAAAGLILAMAAKMATPVFRRGAGIAPAFAILTFAGVALLQLPLVAVLLVIGPISIAFAWWRLK